MSWQLTESTDLPVSEQETISYLYANHLQTLRLATSQTRSIVWRRDSDCFGTDTATVAGSRQINIRFPGQYYNAESGLHYNHHRCYGSILGRYITSDPIGLQDGVNTYLYAMVNPIIYIDPRGLAYSPRGEHGIPRGGGGSVGLGGGVLGMSGIYGAMAAFGTEYDSFGNVCDYAIVCQKYGVGFSASVFTMAHISSGTRLCSGVTTSKSLSAGVGFSFSKDSLTFSGTLGVGGGGHISIDECVVSLTCTNDSCECG